MAPSWQDKSDPSSESMVFIVKAVSGRRDTRLDSASSFAKISVGYCAQDFPYRFSGEAAVQDPFVRLSVQGV